MLGQAPVGVRLAQLVHLARQLTQQLYSDHAVPGGTLFERILAVKTPKISLTVAKRLSNHSVSILYSQVQSG